MMKKFTKLSFPIILGSLMFSSCGGGGSSSSSSSSGVLVSGTVSDNGTNTTTANNLTETNVNDQNFQTNNNTPSVTTLDATKLKLTANETYIFNFSRLSGNGTAASPEIGFANSFDSDGGEAGGDNRDSLENGIGYDVPVTMKDITYSYINTGPFTGTLQIFSDITVDTGGDIVEGPPPRPNSEPFDLLIGLNNETFFLTFGSNGTNVDEISIEGSNILSNKRNLLTFTSADGTTQILEPLQLDPNSPVDLVNVLWNTPNHGVYLRLQDDSPLPLNYSAADPNAFRVTPAQIFPLDLSDAGAFSLSFVDTSGAARTYELFGAQSSNIGAVSDPALGQPTDQGIYRMRLIINGNTIDSSGNVVDPTMVNNSAYDDDVFYAWHPVPGTADNAILTITYTDDVTGTETTEQYNLLFSSFESGNLRQTQPNTNLPGIFSIPQADQT